jgi:branched-chain amino acid transport system ATP-binding protein
VKRPAEVTPEPMTGRDSPTELRKPAVLDVNLQAAGYGGLPIVRDLSFSVNEGEVVALLGANGAGKTTALRALMGEVRCEARRLHLDGNDVTRQAAWRLVRNGVAFVPDGARCFPNMSVNDNLTGARRATRLRRPVGRLDTRLDLIYSLFPVLLSRRAQLAGTLSGGERQMLAVGRALTMEPRVLILDEPSAGLAPRIVEELFDALATLTSNGASIVLAEQNVMAAGLLADRAIVLDQGEVVLNGVATDVLNDARLTSAYLGL